MTEREQNDENLAHTIIETTGKRSKRTFFKTWKTLKKKKVTLTNSSVSKAEI